MHPFWSLADGELELILRLVLVSGSLKELAQSYKVSYPTIRAKLTGVIDRLRSIIAKQTTDPMVQLVEKLLATGELSNIAARAVLEAHRKDASALGTLPVLTGQPA